MKIFHFPFMLPCCHVSMFLSQIDNLLSLVDSNCHQSVINYIFYQILYIDKQKQRPIVQRVGVCQYQIVGHSTDGDHFSNWQQAHSILFLIFILVFFLVAVSNSFLLLLLLVLFLLPWKLHSIHQTLLRIKD